MSDEVFIIGHGELIITPGKEPDRKTVTFKCGESYHKLREIQVGRASEIEQIAGSAFNREEWCSIGRGDSEILLNKDEVLKAFSLIKDPQEQKKAYNVFSSFLDPTVHVESIMQPSPEQEIEAPPSSYELLVTPPPEKISRVFKGVSETITPVKPVTQSNRKKIFQALKDQAYKITCIMTPEGELQVVALKYLTEGTCKRIKLIRSIWEKASAHSEFGPVAILATSKEDIAPLELLCEVGVSQKLIAAGVPNILVIREVKRRDVKKTGLMMEFCRGGTISSYTRSHFDPSTSKLKPEFRKEHISLLRQTSDALCGMHEQNLLHCDVKADNMLVKLIIEQKPEVRVSDFGLVLPKGSLVKSAPGTYPPPELLETLTNQRTKAEKEVLEDLDTLTNFWSTELNWSPLEVEVEKKKYLEDKEEKIKNKMYGILIGPEVDAWGFGVLLFRVMHNQPNILHQLSWKNSSSEINHARDQILDTILDLKDPVDQIIAKLLAKDPGQRIRIQEARGRLLTAI